MSLSASASKMPAMNKVSVGPATYVGYGFSALTAGATTWAAAEHELSGHGKWLAFLSVLLAIATNAGRQLQAHGQITSGVVSEEVPSPPAAVSESVPPVSPTV